MLRRVLSILLMLCLVFQQAGFASVTAELDLAGRLSRMAAGFTPDIFRPVHIRFFSYDALNDNIKVMLDKGSAAGLNEKELNLSSQELLNYFLIGVSLPNDAFWVNLRPDSENDIIDDYLARTDVGRIMLEADLQLKKDTANFTSPQTAEGREYWDRLYKKAEELYGYQQVSIPTITRPWIVPNEIIVRETKDSAYIYKATLKVMLEEDYLREVKGQRSKVKGVDYAFKDQRAKALNEYSTQLIRELIIPKLTKEVNLSQRYAPLRQVYYSLIFSRWFKSRFANQSGKYGSRIDTNDLGGLTSKSIWSKGTFFEAYEKSFAQGEYNIKEPVYTPTGQVIRSYFSGGADLTSMGINGTNVGAGIPIVDTLFKAGLVAPDGMAPEQVKGRTAGSPIKVAINNPGAQERELIRQWLVGRTDGIELVGVNGVSPSNLHYLLTKDFSAAREFKAVTDNWFREHFDFSSQGLVDKKDQKLVLPVTDISNLQDLPWRQLNAKVVIEGKNPQLASSHKTQGAEFVIVAHPALTAVSALIPIISVLNSKIIKAVNFTDIQPPTSLQRGLDNSGTDPVLMRAMGVNIAPAFAKDIGEYAQKVFPSLDRKIHGKIIFSPHVLGSILDVHIVVGEGADVKSINQLFKDAAEGGFKGRFIYSEDPSLVSVDSYQEPQPIFLATRTKATGKIVHLTVLHHEETAFAGAQVPLLVEALTKGYVLPVITSKDSQNIYQEAAEVLNFASHEDSLQPRWSTFADFKMGYIPSSDGVTLPRILPEGQAAIVGLNGPGRTGRGEIWAWQGDPNLDLRMINGSANMLILNWLISEDSIQLSTAKPVVRAILTPEQLKKEISVLLGNYSAEHVKGFLKGLITSQRLALLRADIKTGYLKELLRSWGKPEQELMPAIESLLKSLVGILDINGKKVLVVNERRAVSELPWDAAGIGFVSESTGDLKNADEASAHLTPIPDGKVVISAPAEGAGQSIVLGVVKPTRAARIVDNASCTTNCLMPVVYVLDKNFGIVSQEVSTDHAYTTDQKFAQEDMHKKEPGRGRDGRLSAVPGSTGAAKTAGVVVPKLQGLSDGWAVRTGNPTGSIVVLTAIINGKVTKEQVQKALLEASRKELSGIMAYTLAPIVSTTILGNPASSIVDGNSIEVLDYDDELNQTTIAIDAWYDNEAGFVHRMGNLIVYLKGQSLIEGRAIADIGPGTVELFENKMKEVAPRTVIWNGPMGVVEAGPTSKGTAGVAKSILNLKGAKKIVGGGDTLKTLSEDEKNAFDHVSTGGGAFLEAFQFGVENLPGVKALIDLSTGRMPHFNELLPLLEKGDPVLVRVDFNVPLDSKLNVTDNTRIKAALPTIEALLARGIKVVLMTHLGRPNGKVVNELRTDPIAKELQQLLPTVKVHKLDDCVGQPVEDFIRDTQKDGEIVLLENLRFRLDEEQNKPEFARSLSRLGKYYVNDAFAVEHRANASVEAITKFFAQGRKFSGRLLEKEYDYLKELRDNPEGPLAVVLAGGKVSDKIHIFGALKKKAALFLIGGRMALAFLAAQGKKVGDSTPDAGDIATAKKLLADPDLAGKIVLPVDGVVVSDVSSGKGAKVAEGEVEPSDMSAFEEKFFDYLQFYLPAMTAEGKALAASSSALQGRKSILEEASKILQEFPTPVPSAMDDVENNASFSPAQTKRGGIDFGNSAMLVNYQPMGNFVGLKVELPVLSQRELARFDIEAELARLEGMVEQKKIIPSDEAVAELYAACSQKGEMEARGERLAVLLVKMGILEETLCCLEDASQGYKKLLMLAEALPQ